MPWATGGSPSNENCDNRSTQDDYPACEYCEVLALCNNGSFDSDGNCAGDFDGVLFDDWRLPEIEVYQDIGDNNARIAFFGVNFINNAYTYWSGTTSSNVNSARIANVNTGSSNNAAGKSQNVNYFVRCVRDQ